jgi:hypothetical protein
MPYLLLGLLTLVTGLGIGLGFSETPTHPSAHPLVLPVQTPIPRTQSPSRSTKLDSVLAELPLLPEPSFQFISPKLGWLEPPDQDQIMLTVDGGQTWRTTYIAPTSPGAHTPGRRPRWLPRRKRSFSSATRRRKFRAEPV